MYNMKAIKILFLLCLTIMPGSLMAQDNLALPFLQINPDVRTAGMGDVRLATSRGSYIYSDPTASLDTTHGKLSGTYSIGLYPKISGNRQSFNALALSYRLSDRHAILLGARLLSGLKVDIVNSFGRVGTLAPIDFSVDLGYAFQATDKLSFYGVGTYVNSYNGSTAHVALASVGAVYRSDLIIGKRRLGYHVGTSIDHIGSKVRYGTDGQGVASPSSVSLYLSADTELSSLLHCTLGVSSRYHFSSSSTRQLALSAGAELSLYQDYSLRAGYHALAMGSYGSVGFGYRWKYFSFDLAYMIASESTYNNLRLGISLQL